MLIKKDGKIVFAKKNIVFTAPLHIKQTVKIKNGEMVKYFEWDIFERFFGFIKGLLPRIREKEIGAKYKTLKEGYFGIGTNGEIERQVLPEIDEKYECLIKNVALAISLNENNESIINSSIINLEMNR